MGGGVGDVLRTNISTTGEGHLQLYGTNLHLHFIPCSHKLAVQRFTTCQYIEDNPIMT